MADEWIARWRTGVLRKPLAYLAKLVQQAEAGHFHPELAAQERAKRQEAMRAEQLAAASETASSPEPVTQQSAEELQWIVKDLAQRLRHRP